MTTHAARRIGWLNEEVRKEQKNNEQQVIITCMFNGWASSVTWKSYDRPYNAFQKERMEK